MQMFTRFLERKLWAQKQEDVIDILMFDESIRIKKLRKRGMSLLKRVSIHFLTFIFDRVYHRPSWMIRLKGMTQTMTANVSLLCASQ